MYSIALFSPGRNYAAVTSRGWISFKDAYESVTALLEDEPSHISASALLSYTPVSITLADGHRLTIDEQED